MVSTRLGVDAEAVRAQQQRSSDCMNEAVLSGLKAAATALAVAGGSVALLQRGSEFFRSHFTVGAKASFVMLPVFFTFWNTSEKAVARCSLDNNRRKYAAQRRAAAGEQPPQQQ